MSFYELDGFDPTERMMIRSCVDADTCATPPVTGACGDSIIDVADGLDPGSIIKTWGICETCPAPDAMPAPEAWHLLPIAQDGSIPNMVCEAGSTASYQGDCAITGPDLDG